MISLLTKIITVIEVINITITFYKILGCSKHINVSTRHKYINL